MTEAMITLYSQRLVCALVLVILPMPSNQFVVKRSDDTNPLEAVVEKMSRDVASLQAQVTALQAKEDRTVAFSAYISDEPSIKASANSVIPFRGVMANVGGAYNGQSSTFTAPFSGQYFFIVHADCTTDYRLMSIRLNGHIVIGAHNDHGDGHVTGSGLLMLKAGDAVTITHYNNTGTVDAGRESTFTGFLVK